MERIHSISIQKTAETARFVRDVEAASGQKVSNCYQCGNCSASCPYTANYDIPVNQVMRLVQLGQKEPVLTSRSIWICAGCQACTTRCPCNIDVARVMESLRVMSRENSKDSEPDIRMFFDEFLRSVKMFGRVFEAGLLPVFNFRSGKPFTDMDLAPRVLRKRKLGFLPHKLRGSDEVKGIFERFESHCARRQHGAGK